MEIEKMVENVDDFVVNDADQENIEKAYHIFFETVKKELDDYMWERMTRVKR